MNRQRIYEYLVTARGRLLEQVKRAGEAGYGREFPVGPGTLARTLTHMFISEWYYVERIEAREVAPYAEWPIRDETPHPSRRSKRRGAGRWDARGGCWRRSGTGMRRLSTG